MSNSDLKTSAQIKTTDGSIPELKFGFYIFSSPSNTVSQIKYPV